MSYRAPRRFFEVHGVVIDHDRDEIVFPIQIIEAVAPELALGVVADEAFRLKGWSRRFRLFEVPCRHDGTRPWHDEEMQFVCDIELDTAA